MSFEGFPQTYKKVPSTDHPRAAWQGHSSIHASTEQPPPEAVFSEQLPNLCFQNFQRVDALQQWLVDLLAD